MSLLFFKLVKKIEHKSSNLENTLQGGRYKVQGGGVYKVQAGGVFKIQDSEDINYEKRDVGVLNDKLTANRKQTSVVKLMMATIL